MATSSPRDGRPQTPPHYPRYGIHMDTDEIREVLREVDASIQLLAVEELSPGRSYNNRIYFLTVYLNAGDTEAQELVLKVNGRFWGREKMENEVACLQLLQTYCPSVPSPRVLAWTGSNSTIARQPIVEAQATNTSSRKLWILMTRVPGEPIDTFDFDEKIMGDIAKQLAEHVANWRQLIPPQEFCGNISFTEPGPGNSNCDLKIPRDERHKVLQCTIRGMLGDNVKWEDGVSSSSQYYRLRLEDKMERLSQGNLSDADKTLSNDLGEFMQRGLPRLFGASARPESFVFTHYDLSPRNVLVSLNPLQITGIVDFEFAGFYSPREEFLNDFVHNKGDWPESAYNAYLERLEGNGIATPGCGLDREIWQGCICLEKLLQNIAPWWLPGDFTGEELLIEHEKVRSIVLQMLEDLAHSGQLTDDTRNQ